MYLAHDLVVGEWGGRGGGGVKTFLLVDICVKWPIYSVYTEIQVRNEAYRWKYNTFSTVCISFMYCSGN